MLLPDAVTQRLAARKGTDGNDFAAHHDLDAASKVLTQQMVAVQRYAATQASVRPGQRDVNLVAIPTPSQSLSLKPTVK